MVNAAVFGVKQEVTSRRKCWWTPQVNAVYAQYFDADPPARMAYGVAALPFGAEVEIDAVAVVS